MEACFDFIQCLEPDMSIKILMCFQRPSDLVRISSVSTARRHFGVAHVIEVSNVIEPVESKPGNSIKWPCLKRDHRIYAFLAQGFATFMRRDCLPEAICASSTDNYPEESIQNTLEPSDSLENRASYWSSEGEANPTVPEKLADFKSLCPFFQYGYPIYSAKAVRFRMGHSKCPLEIQDGVAGESTVQGLTDKFVWTYTSPEFPMLHEHRLQNFELPEPAICIGGILLVELLGRVQRQETDGLYYICIAHVQVVGRPLSPAFDVEVLDSSGSCTLKYYPEASYCWSPTKSGQVCRNSHGRFQLLTASIRGWEQMILNMILGAGVGAGASGAVDI